MFCTDMESLAEWDISASPLRGEGVECIVFEVDNVPDGLDLDTEGRMEDHDGVSLQILKK